MSRVRPAPPIWILLDILMLLVLALISLPVNDQGVRYEFVGLPPGSVVFQVERPIDPEQREWIHFDFEAGRWVTSRSVTPHGRENFACKHCAEFLPPGTRVNGEILVGVPAGIRTRIHEEFFRSCNAGDCSPTLYIDATGAVLLHEPSAEDSRQTS